MIFTKKGVAILLIFVMGLSPVGGALATCSQIGTFLVDDGISVSGSIQDNAIESVQKLIKTKKHHDSKSTIDCDLKGYCVAHLCGNYGLITYTHFFFFPHSASSRVFFLSMNIKEWIVSPESRPPIATL